MKKRLLGLATVATIGMLLTACKNGGNPPVAGQNNTQQTEGSLPVPENQVTEDGLIARLENAPGPGEPNKTDNFVYTTLDYQRIHDTYGIDIISLANPYISLEGHEETPKVKSLSSIIQVMPDL